jgi:calcineurin-like phosphoesterase family protein
METFFTADLHFHHKYMADLRGVGRERLLLHDQKIIDGWNSVVTDADEVWVLGDFSFAGAELNRELFFALKGRKFLVRGNHDPRHVCELPWGEVHDLVSRKYGGVQYVMCHYPLLTWKGAHHGALHLHGHSHGNLKAPASTRVDVGIDTHPEFRPFSLKEIQERSCDLEYDNCDHHGLGQS